MELSRSEQMLVQAISAALRAESVTWTEVSADCWDELMNLALQHKLQPLVFHAVYACPAAETWPARDKQRRTAKQQVLMQTLKTTEFLALYEALSSAGVHPLVIKGILCRELYPDGDFRQSADEDLYVSEAEYIKCCEVLQNFGMQPTTTADMATADEIGWRKKDSALYIELHRTLFDKKSVAIKALETQFSDAYMRAQAYTLSCGKTVISLSAHDHLLYLLLHAYKHFIHSGFGIRQVCDIGLWAKSYDREIQWDLLYAQCKETHVLKFAATIFRIAQTKLDIKPDLPSQWQEIKTDCIPMLKDLLSAGIYGTADQNRTHSASVTLNAVSAHQSHTYGSFWRTVFPKRKALIPDYPILQKHGVLLPYVWCKRLIKYKKETKNGRAGSTTKTIKMAQQRKQLLKQYDIL